SASSAKSSKPLERKSRSLPWVQSWSLGHGEGLFGSAKEGLKGPFRGLRRTNRLELIGSLRRGGRNVSEFGFCGGVEGSNQTIQPTGESTSGFHNPPWARG